jgi:hypothetical protein
MSQRIESARGIERRVFAAHARRVPHRPFANAVSRNGDGIGWTVHLIIRSAIIPIVGPGRMRRDNACVLSEHRRGNGGGKN